MGFKFQNKITAFFAENPEIIAGCLPFVPAVPTLCVQEIFPRLLKFFPRVLKFFPRVLKFFPRVLKLFPRLLKFFPRLLKFFPRLLKFFPGVLKLFPGVLKLFPGYCCETSTISAKNKISFINIFTLKKSFNQLKSNYYGK